MANLLTVAEIEAAAARIRSAGRVFVDTEFHAEHRYLPKLYLVQLGVRDTTWIVDPLIPELLPGLRDALLAVEWVVHGGHQDMRLLHHLYGDLPERVWDSQIAAGLVGPEHFPSSFGKLVQRYLNQKIAKAEALSDWSRRPLGARQIAYAAADVEVLAPLWRALEERLTALGRLDLAAAACDEARDVVLDPRSPDDAWREISGTERLTAHEAAVLQELAAWRESEAMEQDQPSRAILGDHKLLDLARRQPITVESLFENRRFPRRVAKQHGPRIIEAIARGQRRPEWGLPVHLRRSTPQQTTARWLEVVSELACGELRVAHQLVVPTSLRAEIALAPPQTRGALAELLGWRDPLIGQILWRALTGAIDVHLEDGVPVLGEGRTREDSFSSTRA